MLIHACLDPLHLGLGLLVIRLIKQRLSLSLEFPNVDLGLVVLLHFVPLLLQPIRIQAVLHLLMLLPAVHELVVAVLIIIHQALLTQLVEFSVELVLVMERLDRLSPLLLLGFEESQLPLDLLLPSLLLLLVRLDLQLGPTTLAASLQELKAGAFAGADGLALLECLGDVGIHDDVLGFVISDLLVPLLDQLVHIMLELAAHGGVDHVDQVLPRQLLDLQHRCRQAFHHLLIGFAPRDEVFDGEVLILWD